MSELLEQYQVLKMQVEQAYGADTSKALVLIMQKFDAAPDEANADFECSTDYFVNLFGQQGMVIFKPLLEELLKAEGYKQELVLKRKSLQLCWLLKEK